MCTCALFLLLVHHLLVARSFPGDIEDYVAMVEIYIYLGTLHVAS